MRTMILEETEKLTYIPQQKKLQPSIAAAVPPAPVAAEAQANRRALALLMKIDTLEKVAT
jgi:hypothetical protein